METLATPSGAVRQLAAFEHALCCRCGEAVVGRGALVALRAASRFGDWGLSVMVGLVLLLAAGPRAFVGWAVASVAAVVAQKAFKKAFARARPCEHADGPPQRAPIPDRGSFPSGHTLHATMAAVVMSHLASALALVFVPVALLIGSSRVILGVHYPSDVVAGAALGASFALLLIMLG